MTRQQATQLWRILDKDGSGQISKDEFGEALRFWEPRLTKREVESFCSLVTLTASPTLLLPLTPNP